VAEVREGNRLPPDFFDFPFGFDATGHVAKTSPDGHVRDMIHQVLFTSPGERVNRPDFGCGLKQMNFLPNSDSLATATEFLVRGSLERWLGEVIRVEDVRVNARDERLEVEVVYRSRYDGLRREDLFALGTGAD
jgi:uncharacterized protein